MPHTNPIKAMICAIRGFHRDEVCQNFFWNSIGIAEHTHICDDCGKRTLAEIRKIEVAPDTHEIVDILMDIEPEIPTGDWLN